MEQLVNFIIRPPRAEYDPKNDLMEQEFALRGKLYHRKDLEVKNSRGDVLQCSHYVPIVSPEGKPLPCVVYCHGNSGCRADATEAAIILLPSNITVFTLDFSGSGLSGGEYVTLGWNEKDDLKAVVDYLRADGNVSFIGLWGRSMGAVTCLMYGAEDPSIAGMVLDSPFSDLVNLMTELVDTYKIRIPKFTVKFAIQFMRRAIQKKAKFDIADLNTIKVASCCFVPVLIGHATDDDFIQPHHSDLLYDAYVGDKNIIKFEGDHNSPRPQFYFDSINIFFHNVLQPPEDEPGDIFIDSMPFGKDSWRVVQHLSSTSKETETSGSVGSIEQYSKRPMSRTEVPSDLHSRSHQSEAEDQKTNDSLCSSSSDMISFELSNGHPYGPPVPTTMDDDQFVEYQLDDFSGFPCSAEEEEKMLMEAVMLSLKDFDLSRPQTEEQAPSFKADSLELLGKDESESPLIECSPIPQTESTSSTEVKTESTSTSVSSVSCKVDPVSVPDVLDSASGSPCPDKTEPSPGAPINAPLSAVDSGSCGASVCSNVAESIQSSSETDVSANTKVTLTAVRNSGGHNGLIRGWDFKCFKSDQN